MSRLVAIAAVVAGAVGSAKAACDYQALASCTIPATANGTSSSARQAWCSSYNVYLACVENADCINETASQPVHADFNTMNCAAMSNGGGGPRMYTNSLGLHLSVDQDQAVCFHSGAQTKCANTLATVTDVIDAGRASNRTTQIALQALQSAQTSQLTAMVSSLSQVSSDLSTLRTTVEQLRATEAIQNSSIVGLLRRLGAAENELEGHCGRHCYPGEYVSTPCTQSTQTRCSNCTGNTFSPGGLIRSCTRCTQCTDRTHYLVRNCSHEADTVCAACGTCPAGQWAALPCRDRTTRHCRPHTSCPAGTYRLRAGDAVSNTVCANCSTSCGPGHFISRACSSVSNIICSRCSTCSGGRSVDRQCTNTSDTVCGMPIFNGFGGGWRPFMWWRGSRGASLPSSVNSVFENPYGTCTNYSAQHCFGRMPSDLDEFNSELLVMSTPNGASGHAYRWTFDPRNPTSHTVFAAMRDHQTTGNDPAATRARRVWNPQVLRGGRTSQAIQSAQFRVSRGVWSFALDDDNCYCHTAIEIGNAMCGSNNPSGSGVEVFDNSCTQSSTWSNSIFLFYRNTSATPRHRFGVGWKKFWHFVPRQPQVRDMISGAAGSCILSQTAAGARYTPAVCPNMLPSGLNEARTQLLAIDWHGQGYRWQFNPQSSTASNVWRSFTTRRQGRWIGQSSWEPTVLSGTRPRRSQDSWVYRDACGVRSFTLDDDGCYCLSTLEAGKSMCGTGCNGNYGVDRLFDNHCQQVDTGGNGLTLYYREV